MKTDAFEVINRHLHKIWDTLCYQAGMESLLNTWKINPQELVALIQQEGFAQPECLRALAPIESPALINHAGTEPKPKADKTTRRTRTDNLTRAIKSAIIDIGKKPSLDELWRYFEDDKDKTGFIEDWTDTHITWRDTKGNMKDTKKESLANRLSRINS